MSKLQLLGIGVLASGAALGFGTGSPVGLAFTSVCLIVGLVMVVASEARGTRPKRGNSQPPDSHGLQTQVLVAVKEIHARPQRGGKFQEIGDPNQPDLEFDVFLKCWLVNETDVPLGIQSLQLELKSSDGSTRVAERISGDLENWRLGKLQEEWEVWDVHLRAALESVSELDTAQPLQCGLAREGWLHFRLRNVTPSEFKSGPMQISVKDSLSHTHVGTASGARHLPGRIWPVLPKAAPAASSSPEVATG